MEGDMDAGRRVEHALVHCRAEGGAALIIALVLLAVLTLLGTAAVVTGIVDTKIGANYKTSMQAFYAAEAGIAEARARLRVATGVPHIDTTLVTPQWRAYLVSGTPPPDAARQKATALGYDAQQHTLYTSLQSALEYTVVLEPTAGPLGTLQLTSYGSMQGATKTLQIVAAGPPAFTPPAALYLATTTTIQGMTTDITGFDRCGSAHQPAVFTPLSAVHDGQPTITQLQSPTLQGASDIVYNGPAADIQALIDSLQTYANFVYTVQHATHTATTIPGPGASWGQPTLGATSQDPSACDVYNIIHYKTGGTSIALDDGVSGCGLLLVEGDLEIHQDFSWYGLILVTGTLTATSAVSHEQQITGAVLTGASAGTNTLGIQSHLVYCSTAVNLQQLPWRVLSWREMYQ
jgi:hypothetical protein